MHSLWNPRVEGWDLLFPCIYKESREFITRQVQESLDRALQAGKLSSSRMSWINVNTMQWAYPPLLQYFKKNPYCVLKSLECYQVFIVPVIKYFISSKTHSYGMTAFAVHFSGSWSVGVLFKRNCSIDWSTKRWPLSKTMHKTWHYHYYRFLMKVLTRTLFLWYVQSIQNTKVDLSIFKSRKTH